VLEAIIAFPELDADGDGGAAIPEFFHQMAAEEAGKLKCRLRLEATWTDDGSLDGAIEQKYRAVRTFGPFADADCTELKATDRARIQMIYVPATRDGASQVTFTSPLPAVASAEAGAEGGVAGVGAGGLGLAPLIVTSHSVKVAWAPSSAIAIPLFDTTLVEPSVISIEVKGKLVSSIDNFQKRFGACPSVVRDRLLLLVAEIADEPSTSC
jgi:hypothetical protein